MFFAIFNFVNCYLLSVIENLGQNRFYYSIFQYFQRKNLCFCNSLIYRSLKMVEIEVPKWWH